MGSQGAVQPTTGEPSTNLPNDTTPASASSSRRNSCNSGHKFLPETGASRFSQLSPRTWSRKARIITIAAFTLAIVALIPGLAVPLTLKNHQSSHAKTEPLPADGRTTALRIMPLGASITYGLRSTDRNGYRNDLLGLLNQGGNVHVTYVGSRNSGTMAGNAVEGWPGERIDQLLPRARESVPRYLPNVILLNAGTNDCVQDFDVDSTTRASPAAPGLTSNATYNVGTRMRVLVGDLLAWSPNTTVVVSTLINNLDAATQRRVDDANEQFRAVVRELQSEGKSVVLAEMTAEAGGPHKSVMADGTHPNDAGYKLMAKRWYAALVEASQKGFLVQPQ